MVLAARVAGDQAEAGFWAHLPAALAGVKAMLEQQQVGWVVVEPLARPNPRRVSRPPAPDPALRSL
jgi:hypothetical protein